MVIDIFTASTGAHIVLLGKFTILKNYIPPTRVRITGKPAIGSSGLDTMPLVWIVGISHSLVCYRSVGILPDFFHLFRTDGHLTSVIETSCIKNFCVGNRIYEFRNIDSFFGPKTVGIIDGKWLVSAS